MFPSKENEILVRLYESPDNITINGKNYQYDDSTLGNFTCIIDTNGHFIMTDVVNGHAELRRLFRASTNPMKSVVTNTKSKLEASELLSQPNEIRIWPKFEVVSMWRLFGIQDFKPAICDAITAAGGNPESYLYDEYDGGDEYKTYDEMFGSETTEEDRSARDDATAQKVRDQKELGNYMARSKDKDYGMKTSEPSFYKKNY